MKYRAVTVERGGLLAPAVSLDDHLDGMDGVVELDDLFATPTADHAHALRGAVSEQNDDGREHHAHEHDNCERNYAQRLFGRRGRDR